MPMPTVAAWIIRPQVGHEGAQPGLVQVEGAGDFRVDLGFGDRADASGVPHVPQALLHGAGREAEPPLPPPDPAGVLRELQHAAYVENHAARVHCASPWLVGDHHSHCAGRSTRRGIL
jgi:hypothetical protein